VRNSWERGEEEEIVGLSPYNEEEWAWSFSLKGEDLNRGELTGLAGSIRFEVVSVLEVSGTRRELPYLLPPLNTVHLI
jgi:hypothetical protein